MRRKTFLKIVELQTEQAERHLNEVRSIHREMRAFKHDYHNHLQTLRGHIASGDIARALSYIDELDARLKSVDTLIKTGNVSADAILSSKIAQAKAAGIAVTVTPLSSVYVPASRMMRGFPEMVSTALWS